MTLLNCEKARNVGKGFREHDPRIAYFVKFEATQNFGDYLPELFCKELLLHPRVEADVYRLVGSVIETDWIWRDLRHATGRTTGKIAYWGCGLRREKPLDPAAQASCLFFGVRGPLTRDVLELPADTVLGDPGLLAPLLHAPSSSASMAGRAVCIPHIQDAKSDQELLALSGAQHVLRPSIEASETALRTILDEIAAADFVLTGSLHGAIVACAYGRPFAFWNSGHIDVPFKWHDFAASVGIPAVFITTLDEGRRVYETELAPRLTLPALSPILDVCPFQVRPSALLRALAHDGVLEVELARTAAQALDALPSMRLQNIYGLQDLSTAYRMALRSLGSVLRSNAGQALLQAKRRLSRPRA